MVDGLKNNKMNEIKPHIVEKKYYKYLHIHGGSGYNKNSENDRFGGEYDFILYYAKPDELEGIDGMCERCWCIKNNIIFGEGSSIEDAYHDYLVKTKL